MPTSDVDGSPNSPTSPYRRDAPISPYSPNYVSDQQQAKTEFWQAATALIKEVTGLVVDSRVALAAHLATQNKGVTHGH